MHSSIDFNTEQRIDTDRLRLHKCILEEELYLATSLAEHIQTVRHSGCDWDVYDLPVPVHEAAELRRTFLRRIDMLDRVCEIFVSLQSEIAAILEEHAKSASAQTAFPNDPQKSLNL